MRLPDIDDVLAPTESPDVPEVLAAPKAIILISAIQLLRRSRYKTLYVAIRIECVKAPGETTTTP